jgi:hypothetical protein
VCCNDGVEAVVTESEEEAEKVKDKISSDEYNSTKDFNQFKSYEEYKDRYYWHVKKIKMFKSSEEV